MKEIKSISSKLRKGRYKGHDSKPWYKKKPEELGKGSQAVLGIAFVVFIVFAFSSVYEDLTGRSLTLPPSKETASQQETVEKSRKEVIRKYLEKMLELEGEMLDAREKAGELELLERIHAETSDVIPPKEVTDCHTKYLKSFWLLKDSRRLYQSGVKNEDKFQLQEAIDELSQSTQLADEAFQCAKVIMNQLD